MLQNRFFYRLSSTPLALRALPLDGEKNPEINAINLKISVFLSPLGGDAAKRQRGIPLKVLSIRRDVPLRWDIGDLLQFQFIIICHIGESNINHLRYILHNVYCNGVGIIAGKMVIYFFIPARGSYIHCPVSGQTENYIIAPWSAIIGSGG
jgi:hypothetical protein